MKIIEIEDEPFHFLPYKSSGRGLTRNCNLPFYFAYVDHLPGGISSIVATSDLQGRKGNNNRLLGEALSEELILMQELCMIPNINLALSSGDLYDRPELNKLGATGDVTSALNALSLCSPQLIAVHGNHDTVNDSKLNINITIIDGNSERFSGLSIGGVSGIIGKQGRNQRKSKDDYLKYLKKVTNRNNDIILLHQSPQGNLDEQIGEISIRNHFESHGDSLIISGHSYWKNHISEIGKNQILNVDSKVVILTTKKAQH